MDLTKLFEDFRDESVSGRYITNTHLIPILESLEDHFEITVSGTSVLGESIYSIKAGHGPVKVFMWSQMHGNEATTTKAVIDLLNLLKSNDPFAIMLKSRFTFCIVPIANPDGARLYTRENANKVDLNRDSVQLSQPESRLLREVFENFGPDYCYNMHDQRSIFAAGDTSNPATVSFLAPAYNEARDMNATREQAINIIVAMNKTLQEMIPGQVGRFDDSFNINCIGDMFQSLNTPTILFEAGHYQNDYIREKTRKFIFIALLSGFKAIHENVIVVNGTTDYFNIPQNKPVFYDIIYKNVKINYENKQKITNFASHYREVLFENSVILQSYVKEVGELEGFHGHREYDCKGELFNRGGINFPIPEEKADFFIGTDREFVNGLEKK